MYLDLSDASVRFEIDVVKEIKDQFEAYTNRTVSEEIRKAQDYSIAFSVISLLVQTGIVAVDKWKIMEVELEVKRLVGVVFAATALFLLIRFYAYGYSGHLVRRIAKIEYGFRTQILANALMDQIMNAEDEEDRARARRAQTLLYNTMRRFQWSVRVRHFVDLVVPAALWFASVVTIAVTYVENMPMVRSP